MHTMTSNSPPKIQVLKFNTCSWYEMAHEANAFRFILPFQELMISVSGVFLYFPFHSTKVFNEIIIIQMMKFIIR